MHLRRSRPESHRLGHCILRNLPRYPRPGLRGGGIAFVLFSILLWLAPIAFAQTTIHIPTDQPTIQAGINAAHNGDTVLVAPGTYSENINFNGKAITVTTSGGAAVTTIDGGYKAGVATVTFSNGETSASVISNFTIRGGGDTIFAVSGDGGIYVAAASPTIQGNTVTANYCHNIDVEFGTATILNNEISGVQQSLQPTSYCNFASGILVIGTPNSLRGLGTSIVGNTIENNLAGSGINLWAAQNVLIMNNTIRTNTSSDPGSAFTSANSSGTVLVQNLIYGNISSCGGAVAAQNSGSTASNPSILIANNTIVGNLMSSSLTGITNCTDIAQIYPAPYSYGSSGPGFVVINNIISGSTLYPAVNCSWYNPPSESDQPTFQNDILNNAGGPFFGSYCVDVSGRYNNITSDPQFVSPSTGNYHLQSTSPAIDAGQYGVLQTFLAMTVMPFSTDFDGNPRVQGSTIDMGAYECSGTPGNCGLSAVSETLTSSLNPATVGQSVAFTAQLSAATGIPTGTVQFLDGASILSTQAVSGTGSAAFSTGSLAAGSHTITANYQPTGSFGASTASLTQIISGVINGPADFTITLASPTITIETQHHLTTTLTLASLGGFADTLAITCANLPTYVTCRPTPSSASLAANATTSVSLYLDTDSVLGYARNTAPPTRSPFPIAWAFLFAPVSLCAAFLRRNRRPRLFLLLLAMLPLSLALAGCGEIIFPYDPPPSAAPGTYIIPITATGATTNITHNAQLTLVITP